MREILELRLFHQAVTRGEEDVLLFLFQIAHREHGADSFSRLQSNQVAHVLAFAGGADVGDLVDL